MTYSYLGQVVFDGGRDGVGAGVPRGRRLDGVAALAALEEDLFVERKIDHLLQREKDGLVPKHRLFGSEWRRTQAAEAPPDLAADA